MTATFVALTAAFFSVTGIAKLFAGATLSVLIMASALELGKIVGISFLYQYWNDLPKLLKGYLTAASIILMLITSLGIYGFLSGAYQATADKLSIVDQQTNVVTLKKERFQEQLTLSLQERDKLNTNIQELSKGLSNNIVQYRDATSGQLVTTTSAATRTAIQQQLNMSNADKVRLATKIEALTDSITSLDMQVLELNANNDLASEVGPLKFIAALTGLTMDQVVNIFALLIVFVFDPLAVALIVAVNFLIKPTSKEIFTELQTKKLEEFPPDDEQINPQEEPMTLIEVEPYKVYTPPEKTDVEILNKYLDLNNNGIPDWMEKDFNWGNTSLWVNNPIAKLYKQQIVDKIR